MALLYIHRMNRVNSRNELGHDVSNINIVLVIIIIIIVVVVIITKIMFSLCLFVCLLSGLCKSYSTDLHKRFSSVRQFFSSLGHSLPAQARLGRHVSLPDNLGVVAALQRCPILHDCLPALDCADSVSYHLLVFFSLDFFFSNPSETYLLMVKNNIQ